MSKSVLLGPYVGDFKQEVLVFRPYMRYISYISQEYEIFVSSHSNRSFLYDWVDDDNFLPIYEHISRNEVNQKGFIFQDITKTEFNQITKHIRDRIPFSDIDIHTLPYVKNTNGVSYYQKIYSSFTFPDIDIGESPDIVFIGDKSDQSSEVYSLLSDQFDVTVIGDMNNGLETYNEILKTPNFSDNYLRMFNYISKAKMVVTNCSEWVLICNSQQVPVFYCGADSSLFKNDGILNFDNKKCTSICDMDSDTMVNMVKYSYNKMYGGV
ncbi:MAG: hypothetical protein KAS32_03180 [Candidatus Peribacteraceae bacterium]|nr:hypothetical protein [Candidatus Peribacteraceae bacterium]